MKLLFIHGSGSMGEVWRYQRQHFPGSEAIDLPGHPQSQPLGSVEEYADWLRGYVQGRGYADLVLAGHSLGGAIAQLYALRYPKGLKALILVGTGARLRVSPAILAELEAASQSQAAWERWRASLEERYRPVDPQLRKELIEKRLGIGPAVQLNDMLCCHRFDIMGRVHQIRVPTLVICGSQDEMTPPKYSQHLANSIEGAKLVVIEGGSHHVFLEKPEEVNRAIADFLKDLEKAEGMGRA